MPEPKTRLFLQHAARLGGLTFVSSALGLARELLIAHKYGASSVTDSYLVAVSVPMLLYALLFGSGLNVSLVPKLTVALKESKECGMAMFAQFLSGAAVCSIVLGSVLFLFPQHLLAVFAPGLSNSLLAAGAVRDFSPLLFFYVTSFALGSFHCANGKVARWAATVLVQNAILVLVLLVIGAKWGMGGLVLGTISGAFLALLVQARTAVNNGFQEGWKNPFKPGLGRDALVGISAFALVGGLGGDQGTSQMDILLVRLFASRLATGSITILALGNKLMGMPVVLIGAVLALALLPSLSLAIAAEDRVKAGEQLSQALSFGMLLACPITVAFLDISAPIVGAVFRHTALLPNQLSALGSVLRGYSPAVVGLVATLIMNSYLAALSRRRTLIAAGVFSVVVNGCLMWALGHTYGATGIALALSIGSFVYAAVLLSALMPHLPGVVVKTMLRQATLIAAGALVMHLFLLGGIQVHALRSQPVLGGAVLPLAAAGGVYISWLALHRKRLQLQLPGAPRC